MRRAGRSARVVSDVLDATFEELAAAGYGGLRIEQVARRSGVNKTTIYRRWPAKRELVAAAVVHAALPSESIDLGDVRAELIALTRRSVAWLSSDRGRGLARMMMVERADPEVQELVAELRRAHLEPRVSAVQRAIARGELPPDVNATLALELIHSYIIARVVKSEQVVGDGEVAAAVDLVLAGARATAPSAMG